MARPAIILILRAMALLVALGFLVAYVLHASGRLPWFARPETAPAPPAATVLSSSKTISQPVFSARPFDLSPSAPPAVMGGSKSARIVTPPPASTPANENR